MKARCSESGDQVGVKKKVGLGMTISRGACMPSWAPIMRRYSPDASENQEMWRPSGDHAGARSAAPEVRVRLRQSPSSAGTVKMSPRASKRARTPVGESDAFCSAPPMSSQWGRSQGKSPRTVMSTRLVAPVAGSWR